MTTKSFMVHIDPEPKDRPRFGKGRVFTTSRTVSYERNIGWAAKVAGIRPTDEPITLEVLFQVRRPKSVKRLYPAVRPDLDNFLKAVLDGLNNIAFKDDAQIVSLKASKIYCMEGQEPSVHVKIVHMGFV